MRSCLISLLTLCASAWSIVEKPDPPLVETRGHSCIFSAFTAKSRLFRAPCTGTCRDFFNDPPPSRLAIGLLVEREDGSVSLAVSNYLGGASHEILDGFLLDLPGRAKMKRYLWGGEIEWVGENGQWKVRFINPTFGFLKQTQDDIQSYSESRLSQTLVAGFGIPAVENSSIHMKEFLEKTGLAPLSKGFKALKSDEKAPHLSPELTSDLKNLRHKIGNVIHAVRSKRDVAKTGGKNAGQWTEEVAKHLDENQAVLRTYFGFIQRDRVYEKYPGGKVIDEMFSN